MDAIILWLLAAAGFLMLVVARHEIGRAWARGSRLQASAALVVVAGGMLEQSNLTTNPAAVRQITALGFVALCLLAAFASPSRARPQKLVHLSPVLVALALWIWLFIVDALFTYDENPGTVWARTVSGVAIVALLFVQAQAPLNAAHFTSAALVCVSVVMITLPLIPHPLGSCTVFKCSSIGVILLGPFSSGNYFGLEFAMLGGLAMTTIRSKGTLATVIAIASIGLFATNARTSLLALAAGLVSYFLANLLLKAPRDEDLRLRTYGLLALVAGIAGPVIGMILVFSATPDSFSNRGMIWILGRQAVGNSSVTGIGLDSWSILQGYGDVSYHFAHSEYMAIFFSGGFIAISVLAAFLVSAIYAGSHGLARPGRGLVLVLVFAILGLTEVVWNPLTIDGLSWHAIAVCCIAAPQLIRPGRTHDSSWSDVQTSKPHNILPA